MTHNLIEYPLVEGFIHNWLIVGPAVTPEPLANTPASPAIMPVDGTEFEVGGQTLRWVYYPSRQDHQIDLSAHYEAPGQANAWAYVLLKTPVVDSTRLAVFGSGPVEVWLNGQVLEPASSPGTPNHPASRTPQVFQTSLQTENSLFIRFAAASGFAARHTLAVRLADFATEELGQKVTVCVPTRAMFPHRHKFFEALFESAYLEQAAYHKGNLIDIRWAEDAEMTTSYAYKVRDSNKQIYVEGNAEVKLEAYDAGHPQRIWERQYYIALQAPMFEHWEQDLRFERLLPFQVLDTEYASKPGETYYQRRKLALEHASRREPQLFAEIAKMTAESWEKVEPKNILEAVEGIRRGDAGRNLLLVGLLGMLYRYKDHENFPQAVVKPAEACVLDFDYNQPETGAQSILEHTAAILAGGRYPRRKFNSVDLSGAKLCQKAEAQAVAWMRSQGTQGLSAWSGSLEIERTVVALTHLTSLAEDETVCELAAVLLDKILFLLAANSHQGAFGSALAHTSAGAVKSAQLDAAAGINRLLFGVGVYNPHIAGPVSLACSDYEYPSFFAEMAANPPAVSVHKERQTSAAGEETNLVTYRTPDGMLSSVQDYKPGQAGCAEHVWQATLGADAIVYTNHPGAMGEQEGCQPGFWLGNGVLPRLAQWKENLVAIYNLPEDDWLGFTHAYFPITAFDEHVFARGWAFARLGDGFVGLTCSQDFELLTKGPSAFRELRAPGRRAVWLCVMGRTADYRGFRKFQKRCMAIKPTWKDLGVGFESPQGDGLIEFGWEGEFKLNGVPQPLDGFKHIENPFCSVEPGAGQMDIQYGDILMRLNFD